MILLFLCIVAIIAALLQMPVCYAKSNQFLARSLGSNMVFQRNSPFKVYGFASRPLSQVSAKFNGATYRTTAARSKAADGGHFWSIELPAMSGGFTEFAIDIASSTGEVSNLRNILFGDVFLCSGQSNMQLSLPADTNATAEIADAANYPYIRIMNVGQNNDMPQATAPLDDLYSTERPGDTNSSWVVGSSKAVADEALDSFYFYSAACWMFGKNVFQTALQSSVPVGLVSSCWGGTIIESWSPPEVLQQCADPRRRSREIEVAAKEEVNVDPLFSPKKRKNSAEDSVGAVDVSVDSVLYYTMIAPLKNMNFKGIVWYQGESNCAYGGEIYACMQDGMVGAWRTLFDRGDIPFIYTQLSTWNNGGGNYPNSLPQFRLWQTKILDKTASVAMISAADLGDPDSPYGDIHPRHKSEVGRRLAMAASSLVYNVSSQEHMGPKVLQASTFISMQHGLSARVTFSPESCGIEGLRLKDPQVCPDSGIPDVSICGVATLVYSSLSDGSESSFAAAVQVYNSTSIDFMPSSSSSSQQQQHYISNASHKLERIEYCLGDYPLITIYNSANVPLLPSIIYL